MKRSIKTIILLTLLALALAFTAACNNGDDEPEETPTEEAATPTPEPEPVEEDPAEEDPVVEDPPVADTLDFGGREFVIFTHNPGVNTFDPDPTIEDPTADDRHWANLQRIYEEFNGSVRHEVVAYEDIFALFVTSVMAGNPLGDLVEVPSSNLASAIAQGLIMPLDEFIPADEEIWATSGNWTVPATFLNNRYYALGANSIEMGALGFLVYNKDIIAAAGLEDPGAVYDRGEWDWDTFLEYLRETTTIGPDGVHNQFGLGGSPGSLLPMILASNAATLMDPTDFSFAMDNPRTIHAMEFAVQMFNTERLLATPNEEGDWWADTTAAAYGNIAFWPAPYWMLGWAFGDIPLGGVPFPAGPDNPNGYAHFQGFSLGMAVPTGTEDPLAVYRMFNEMQQADRFFSPYALDSDTGEVPVERIFRASLEGWIWTLFDTIEDANRVNHAMNYLALPELGLNVSAFFSGDIVMGLVNGESPAQLIETHRPVIEDELEEMFGALR